jgi:putative FmdB family regulatory protein
LTPPRHPVRLRDSEVSGVPLYEYQCPRCGRFEVIRRFSDAALTNCPKCDAEIQKLFSAPAIQFKGTGWYVTDYARKAGGTGDAKSGEPKGSEAASTSTSKEASGATTPSAAAKESSGSGSTPASK